MKVWKEHEKATAKNLGGQRVGVTGLATADVVTPHLAVECKSRSKLPKWLHLAMAQAVRTSKREQLPIVVLHETDRRHDFDYVVIRMRDYREWYGAIDTEADQGHTAEVAYEPGDE